MPFDRDSGSEYQPNHIRLHRSTRGRGLAKAVNLAKYIARHGLAGLQLIRDRARWYNYYRPTAENMSREDHLRGAVAWLIRAQDAGADRGVAYGTRFGEGFDVSYPETTGYIIPTFLKLAERTGDDSFVARAIDMGDWEISVQLDCGAVMGAKVTARPPSPAIFNTGQVLLGWAALYKRTREERFRAAARRAATWMLEMQEANGNWIRGNSRYCRPGSTLYNVKAAWGLCEAGLVGNWPDAIDGAVRSAEYCLSRQLANGWFADCCLEDPLRPLLHTQAYAMQGLVGIGEALGRSEFIAGAAKAADGLIGLMAPDGFLPGCFDQEFRGTVSWSCPTGTAQTSVVWGKLARLTGEERYREACRRANRYLMAHHDITHPDPSVRGGVTGSWPVWGDYGRFRILNWATNFFVEALLLEADLASQRSH